ncbi:MAG TPA: DUF502 domain-containing protein [Limnochorda sp.]
MQAAARWLRTTFFAGLAVVVPVVLTLYLVRFAFTRLDALLAGVVAGLAGRPVPGGGAVASLALILAAGVMATNFLGRRTIQAVEELLRRIPGIGAVYGAIKAIMHSVVRPNRGQFRRAVLVPFPPGLYSVGFVTHEEVPPGFRGEEPLTAVYVPTTPNPTTGFLFLVPRAQCRDLDMPVSAAFQAVISAGLVMAEKGEAGGEHDAAAWPSRPSVDEAGANGVGSGGP